MEHDSILTNSNFLVGFEKFIFKNSDETAVKSLAISLDREFLNLGSMDSSNLEFVQFSYIITKESVACSPQEIMVLNPKTDLIECEKCPSNSMPNSDNDECICKDDYYLIDERCYKTPDGGEWNSRERTFVCDEDHTMIFDKKNDEY